MIPDYRVAIHESGHAISSCLLGIPLTYVTVIPADRQEIDDYGYIRKNLCLGHAQNSPCFYKKIIHSKKWRENSNNYLDIVHAEIMVICAGNVAELLEFGYSPRFIDHADFRLCRKLMSETMFKKNPDYDIQRLYEQTKKLLSTNMKVVRVLARQLSPNNKISGNECLLLVAFHLGIKVEDIQQNIFLQIHSWPEKPWISTNI